MTDSIPTETRANPDCLEGCDGDHKHKWEIEPHPQTGEADVLVEDDDEAARGFFLMAAEQAWDCIEPGEERVIKIRCNKVAP